MKGSIIEGELLNYLVYDLSQYLYSEAGRELDIRPDAILKLAILRRLSGKLDDGVLTKIHEVLISKST